MDGYELAAALREKFGAAAPRIFALTGYGQQSDLARSRAAGFAGHFVKPVDVPARRVVGEKRRALRQLRRLLERLGGDDRVPANQLADLGHRRVGLDAASVRLQHDAARGERGPGIAQVARGLEPLEPLAPGLHRRLNLLGCVVLLPVRVAALVDQQKIGHTALLECDGTVVARLSLS